MKDFNCVTSIRLYAVLFKHETTYTGTMSVRLSVRPSVHSSSCPSVWTVSSLVEELFKLESPFQDCVGDAKDSLAGQPGCLYLHSTEIERVDLW